MSTLEKEKFLAAALSDTNSSEVLSSMLLLDGLPARADWVSRLGASPSARSVDFLMRGVARTLWHQTQEATDCRWVRLLAMMAAGLMKMPEEAGREIINYPNAGDMKKVRPSIRSAEISFSAIDAHSKPNLWPNTFWKECLQKSPCFPLLREQKTTRPVEGTTIQRTNEVHQLLIRHGHNTKSQSGVDARHDTTFGLGLYSLGILRELLGISNSTAIIGRFGLRALLDSFDWLLNFVLQSTDINPTQIHAAGQAPAFIPALERAERRARIS
jgi:hypothetical protein